MEEAIRDMLKKIERAAKPASSLPWEPDVPHTQPIYTFDALTQTWQAGQPAMQGPAAAPAVKKLALFSWNIDFMVPHGTPRMEAGLAELRARISALAPDTAAVVFLQECVAADLDTIGRQAWVRAGFRRTDVDTAQWTSGYYGTTTLVDRRLDVARTFRVHYSKTRMERDALFVDVVFRGAEAEADADAKNDKGKVIRFCNTHLESLALEPPFRPAQVALAAKFMQDEAVHGALLAGDLNAIQPFDKTLHSDNGLRDAYLALGGREDSEEGYTWGQQAAPELRRRFGCSRMDKVWYCGGVAVTKFERFGADVEVADEKERDEIMRWGGFEKAWITDHLGVYAEIAVEEDGRGQGGD